MFKRGRTVLSIGVLCLLNGCATASKTPDQTTPTIPATEPAQTRPNDEASPVVAPIPALTTPDQANDEFSRAEQDLAAVFGHRNAKKETPLAQGATSEDKPADVCDNACRAFASMQRAAARLCELANDSDPRCTSANERLINARKRVQTACPACEAAARDEDTRSRP